MAYRLNRWIAGGIAGCAVIALVYLPPRGQPAWLTRFTGRSFQPEKGEARLRANALAQQWREVNAELRWLKVRAVVREQTEQRRAAGQFGPVTIVEGGATGERDVLQPALDSVWSGLGLKATKIGVAVLARFPSEEPSSSSLTRSAESVTGNAFILPDTVDRSICLVQSRVPFWLFSKRGPRQPEIKRWARQVLGPCAYYARFGMPSERVERWLVRRRFDVAMTPSWTQPARLEGWTFEDFMDEDGTLAGRLMRQRIIMFWIYSYPRATASCFVGRPEVCRRTIAVADAPGDGPLPRLVLPFGEFDPTKVQLVFADQFLAEVVRKAGPERFQDFWTTSLPVDSALSLAVGEPIGEFITSYHARISPLLPVVGAAAKPRDASLTLLAAALFLGLAMLVQRSREVR